MNLHYLKDKAALNGSRELVLDKILKRQISAANIENLPYCSENIAKRILHLSQLKTILGNNDTVFKYGPKNASLLGIDAEVLLKNKVNNDNFYF